MDPNLTDFGFNRQNSVVNLTVFILVHHTRKLNYRIIIVNTVQCASIRIYLLPLHVSVN
jgi:hypothetical protein